MLFVCVRLAFGLLVGSGLGSGLDVFEDFCGLETAGVCDADCRSASCLGCSDATPKRLAKASHELCSIDFSRGGSTEGGGLSDSLGLASESCGRSDKDAVASGAGATSSLLGLVAESPLVAFLERGA